MSFSKEMVTLLTVKRSEKMHHQKPLSSCLSHLITKLRCERIIDFLFNTLFIYFHLALFKHNLYSKYIKRKWKHFVRSGNVLTILQGNDLSLDLRPWPCGKSRSSIWLTCDPNIRLLGPIVSFVYIHDMCALIPYQGQGQRSMSRSLPSKIVITLPVLTKCFHFLLI